MGKRFRVYVGESPWRMRGGGGVVARPESAHLKMGVNTMIAQGIASAEAGRWPGHLPPHRNPDLRIVGLLDSALHGDEVHEVDVCWLVVEGGVERGVECVVAGRAEAALEYGVV